MLMFIIPAMAFIVVSALIGLLASVLRDNSPKTVNRLETLIGKRRRDDERTDILRATAFESDKKSLMELLTPRFVLLIP